MYLIFMMMNIFKKKMSAAGAKVMDTASMMGCILCPNLPDACAQWPGLPDSGGTYVVDQKYGTRPIQLIEKLNEVKKATV